MSLSLFPSHVAIGKARFVDADGKEQTVEVFMTPEFGRAMSDLFDQVGGDSGLSLEDVAIATTVSGGGLSDPGVLAVGQEAGLAAEVAELKKMVQSLQDQVTTGANAVAELGMLRRQIENAQLENFQAPSNLDWESPGRIGRTRPNTGKFKNLEVVETVTVKGNFVSVGPDIALVGGGGNTRFRDDAGGLRWLIGLLGSAGAIDFSVYDVVAGAPRLTIDSPGGTVRAGVGIITPGQAQASTFRSTIATGAGAPMIVNSTDMVVGLFAETAHRLSGASAYGPAATDLPTTMALANNIVSILTSRGI